MTYNRWIIAGTLALALGACRTASDKRTASTRSDREAGATAQTTTSDDDRRKTDRQDPQDVAAEQAPSTRPQEGVGGLDPHPMPSKDQQGNETYTGNAPQEPSLEGRVPESRQGDAQASATGNAGAASTGTGSTGTSDTGTGASASAGTGDVGASGSVGTGGAGASASAGTGNAGVSGSVGTDGAGASAGGTGSTGSAAAGTTATPSEVSGRVALVDKDAHELAIDSGTATTQVKVAKDAQILINGSKGSFGDIKQGAQVRASLDQSSGDVQATRVEVTSKSKK